MLGVHLYFRDRRFTTFAAPNSTGNIFTALLESSTLHSSDTYTHTHTHSITILHYTAEELDG